MSNEREQATEIEIRKLERWILNTFVVALGAKGIANIEELRTKLHGLKQRGFDEAKEMAAQADVAWLIERGGLCLGFCENRFAWVTFTNESALRFARSVDAYSFKETVKWTPFNLPLEGAIVTEHMWDRTSRALERKPE